MVFSAISTIHSDWDKNNPVHLLVDRMAKRAACGVDIGSNFTVKVLVPKKKVTCLGCKSTKIFKNLN